MRISDWSSDVCSSDLDGVLNVSANCLDRHLESRGDDIAIIWEPDDPQAEPRRISYRELHAEVCRFANVLKAAGAKKGDRITIYLPMIPDRKSTRLNSSH